MAVLKPRTKLVYFRVSEEEYQRLHALCHEVGARSLSDLVRRSLLDDAGSRENSGGHVEALAERIERLARVVEELREKFEKRVVVVRDFPN